MMRDRFVAITSLGQQVADFARTDAGGESLGGERLALATAIQDVQGMVEALAAMAAASESDPREIYRVGLNTTRLLFAVGDVIVGWLLLRQAAVALDALTRGSATDRDHDFYVGKVASAQWFCAQVLPHLRAERRILESASLDVMELSELSF